MYALKLDANNRIMSACRVLPKGKYDGMPIVDTQPDGDITNYLYIDGEYIYDPKPKDSDPEPDPVLGEDLTADEMATAIMEGVNEV